MSASRNRAGRRDGRRDGRRGRSRREPEMVRPELHRTIIINEGNAETRIAILEDHRLVELLVERESDERILGNVYKGRVSSVLPGMQAAFVDVGLDKNAFLHFSDVYPSTDPDADFGEEGPAVPEQPAESISDVLKKGQEILVQIVKEAIGSKGPRVTTNISIPGRYLVLMPGARQLGVSKKIEQSDERLRVKKILDELVGDENFGFIVRTAADGKTERDFEADVKHLSALWKRLVQEAAKRKAPRRIYRELGITSALIRDVFTEEVDSLVIDSPGKHEEIASYLDNFAPELRPRLKLYEGDIPVFDCYEIERALESSLDRKVMLPHGGYIALDHTEALMAIDVNTGRYTGSRDPEETILRTNLDAAHEIPQQLRLRDVGGIIVIDFIDMESEENKNKVLRELRSMLNRDRSRTKTLRISDMGLVEMTRKRVGPSLLQRFSENCPCCAGLGQVLSRETMAMRVEQAIGRAAVYLYETDIRVSLHPRLLHYMREQRGSVLKALKRKHSVTIRFESKEDLGLMDFKLFSVDTGRELTEKTWA